MGNSCMQAMEEWLIDVFQLVYEVRHFGLTERVVDHRIHLYQWWATRLFKRGLLGLSEDLVARPNQEPYTTA